MRRRMLMQQKEDKWNYIMCKLNVTTTAARTTVISTSFTGSNQIDYITFNKPDDNTHYPYDTGFQFTVAGERIMYIHFKGQPTNLDNLFLDINCITYVDMNELDTSKVTSMNGMCQNCNRLVQCLMADCRADSLTQMINTFNSCSVLKYVDFGSYVHGNFKPRKLTDIRNMFNWCGAITTINMSMFDLSTVTEFGYTWGNCGSLVELFLSTGFSSTASMSTNMFSGNTKSGKIYYNKNYDVSRLTSVKPSSWQMVQYDY